jgi:alkylated DNA repair dioxygenase AlkB
LQNLRVSLLKFSKGPSRFYFGMKGATRHMIEGLTYVDDFLGAEEQRSLLEELNRLSFYHDTFRGRTLKRSYAQFGFRFGSTGRKLERTEPFPDFLLRLTEEAGRFCIIGETVNQCIIARYPPGAGIGWHTDASGFGNCIIGVSIGGPGRLQFRRSGAENVALERAVLPGSLYRLQGPARWDYQHRVLPVRAARFALTMRHVPDG